MIVDSYSAFLEKLGRTDHSIDDASEQIPTLTTGFNRFQNLLFHYKRFIKQAYACFWALGIKGLVNDVLYCRYRSGFGSTVIPSTRWLQAVATHERCVEVLHRRAGAHDLESAP